MSDYLTTSEAAEILRMPSETLRYWRHVGKGPHGFKVGKRVLYAREDVEAFLAAASMVDRPAQIPPAHERLGRPAPVAKTTAASIVCPHCAHGIALIVKEG